MDNKRKPDGQDFSPKLLAVWREPPSPLPRALLGTLLLLLTGLLLWAFFGRLDIVARAEGTLVPRNRVQIVQPFEGGRVAEILVSEGQRVHPGQALMRMDASISEVETDEMRRELAVVRMHLQRVAAELQDEDLPLQPDHNPELYRRVHQQLMANQEAYQDALDEQQAALARTRAELVGAGLVRDKLQETLPIFRSSETAYMLLAESGDAAEIAVLERRRERIEVEQDLEQQHQHIVALEGQIEEIRTRLDRLASEHRQQLLRERSELEDREARLAAELQTRAYRNRLLSLVAPRGGIVKNLATHTEGYVVPSGTMLMTIIPTDEPLQAEVFIHNQDVGFVRPDQTARLKLSAYPFQRFGTIESVVDLVSPDSNRDEENGQSAAGHENRGAYRAMLTPGQQHLEKDGERLELRPGMAVVAEIKLGERSVMEYLLSPIRRTLDYAGKER